MAMNRSAGGGFIQAATAVLVAHPLTMACWFKTSNNTSFNTLMEIKFSGADTKWVLVAKGDTAGDPIYAASVVGGTYNAAITSSGYSINTWTHACGVFVAANLRRSYINGGSGGQDTVNRDPSAAALDQTRIVGGATGDIAEVAIWNVDLTADEVALLAKPVSPLLVRPERLALYFPLVRELGHDLISGLSFSVTGAPDPTVVDHPGIFYPGMASIPSLAAGAPPAGPGARSYGVIFG